MKTSNILREYLPREGVGVEGWETPGDNTGDRDGDGDGDKDNEIAPSSPPGTGSKLISPLLLATVAEEEREELSLFDTAMEVMREALMLAPAEGMRGVLIAPLSVQEGMREG